MKTVAIIPAGGTGKRMGSRLPKQYLSLAGFPILVHTLKPFQRSPLIDEIFLAVPKGDLTKIRRDVVATFHLSKVSRVLAGGRERQDSVWNALMHVRREHDIVLVHDAVRPFVSGEIIERAVAGAKESGAVATGVPIQDTVKRTDPAGTVTGTVSRDGLWSVQTPQAFRRDVILDAYKKAADDGFYGTDDASLVERMGIPVRMIPGHSDNIKVTIPEDLERGRRFFNGGTGMRIGFGYDSHRLVPARKLVLGGVPIPHEKGLLGHSDADVLIHAVCDAILGASGLGDIGRQFPDTDPAYRDISSLVLLDRVRTLTAENGYRIRNVDSSIVLEKPKLGAHLSEMAENIASVLRIPASQVSVKAKTNEGMGLVGAGEGAAAFAVSLIETDNNP